LAEYAEDTEGDLGTNEPAVGLKGDCVLDRLELGVRLRCCGMESLEPLSETSSTSSELSSRTDLTLGESLGDLWECSEPDDVGGRRLDRGCDRGWASADRFRWVLRKCVLAGAVAVGLTGVASCSPS